jgi:hypothetical protein
LVPLPLLQFRELTMRLAFLLQTSNESKLSDTLNDKVDEYSGMVQLLHTAADEKLLALGLINFDTMQPDFPPGVLLLVLQARYVTCHRATLGVLLHVVWNQRVDARTGSFLFDQFICVCLCLPCRGPLGASV